MIPLKKQKEILIDMLEKLTAFLDANQLGYTLAFGTLIGAVRHGGFIPWDDDIDIAMPYEDYQKLIGILRTKKIAENIEFSCHANNPNHLWAFGKVYDTRTKLDELIFISEYKKRQDSMKFGLYIDIFPIYPAPDKPEEQTLFERKIKSNYKNMIRSSRKVVFPKGIGNFIKTIIYKIAFLPYRIRGIDYYLSKHDRLIRSYMNKGTSTVCSNLIIDRFAFFETSIYEQSVLVPFENIKARIPENYDVILKRMYGDYMTLPPEEKRRTHTRYVEYR